MIREILIVEDRNGERDAYERIAQQYGRTFTAANLDDALAFLSEHRPSIVISDLHLHDGNRPLEVATQIYNSLDLHVSRLYFMTTDLGDAALTAEIRAHFPSIKIVEKSQRNLERLFADFRHNERGQIVESMDMGTATSRESIRAVVKDVIAEMLADLEMTWFDVKTWAFSRKKRAKAWDRLAWAVGPVIFTTLFMVVLIFIGNAILTALKVGLQP